MLIYQRVDWGEKNYEFPMSIGFPFGKISIFLIIIDAANPGNYSIDNDMYQYRFMYQYRYMYHTIDICIYMYHKP